MRYSKWLSITVIGAAVGVATAWTLRTPLVVEAQYADASDGPIVRRILATGTLQAVTTVDVGSQVTGIVQALGVDFNSIVHAKQVIARLDPSLFQAALDSARANLGQAHAAVAQAQANLLGFHATEDEARRELVRAKELAADQLIDQADLDAAQIAMDAASADVRSGESQVGEATAGVARAEGAVKEASVNLDRTVIRSPIDGLVLARNVEVGQTVSASLQAPVLFSMADLARMQVQVDIDESDVGGVVVGEPATFTVETYPDEEFSGTLTQVRLQPTVAASVVTYTAIVRVANPDARLRPGFTAEVSLAGSRKAHVVRIPNSALSFRPPDDVLRVLGQAEPQRRPPEGAGKDPRTTPRDVWRFDGRRFTPIPVTLGLADAQWSEVLSGSVRSGDALVTSAAVSRRPRL